MSRFFDDLERQLHAAASARSRPDAVPAGAGPPRRRGWLRSGLRAAPAALAVAITLAVVAGALLLLTHRRRPAPQTAGVAPTFTAGELMARTPRAQLMRELAFMRTATRGVQRSPACRLRSQFGVRYIPGSPGSDLLSTLGVLRRPATAADRLRPSALASAAEIYAGYVRRTVALGGVEYYIVPTRNPFSSMMPSDRCFALQEAALARRLPSLPAALRAPTRTLQAAMITYDEALRAHAPRDTVCIVAVQDRSGSAECGVTAAAIRRGLPESDNNGTFSGVVPDGVASVTLRFPAVAGHAARSVTTAVHGNGFAVYVPHVPGGAGASATAVWRSADGRVIKTITPPRPQAVLRYCRTHPLPCLTEMGSYSTGGGASGPAVSSASSTGSSASATSTTTTSTTSPQSGG